MLHRSIGRPTDLAEQAFYRLVIDTVAVQGLAGLQPKGTEQGSKRQAADKNGFATRHRAILTAKASLIQ